MTVTYNDVISAILAVDTYARDSPLGFSLPGLGNAVGEFSIGGADRDNQNQFFAQEYINSNGQIVISYQGIDNVTQVPNPVGVSIGDINGAVVLAAQFYQSIVKTGPLFGNKQVTVVGYSYGGALAAIVCNCITGYTH